MIKTLKEGIRQILFGDPFEVSRHPEKWRDTIYPGHSKIYWCESCKIEFNSRTDSLCIVCSKESGEVGIDIVDVSLGKRRKKGIVGWFKIFLPLF